MRYTYRNGKLKLLKPYDAKAINSELAKVGVVGMKIRSGGEFFIDTDLTLTIQQKEAIEAKLSDYDFSKTKKEEDGSN